MAHSHMTTSAISSGPEFQVARPAHDEQIRRLFRENPMPAGMSLSMEHEPSYFGSAAIDGCGHETIVAVENDRVICAGSIRVRRRFLNGSPARIGYLGGLRLDAVARGRASIILRGYRMFHDLHRETGGPPLYFSSIFSANVASIRFLERGLPGMPTYRRIAEFVTLVLHARRRRGESDNLNVRAAVKSDLPAISELLNRQNRQFQFAPVWTVEAIQACRELHPADFHIARDCDGQLVGCAALWDQRAIRQMVVRGYAPALRRLRPLVNLTARILGTPPLPAVGQIIRQAFVSHVAAANPEILPPLLRSLATAASRRGLEYLTVGFDSRDPRLQVVRRHFGAREYASRIYAVHWEEDASAQQPADGIVSPEVALL
jgi:hypothetical protein